MLLQIDLLVNQIEVLHFLFNWGAHLVERGVAVIGGLEGVLELLGGT